MANSIWAASTAKQINDLSNRCQVQADGGPRRKVLVDAGFGEGWPSSLSDLGLIFCRQSILPRIEVVNLAEEHYCDCT